MEILMKNGSTIEKFIDVEKGRLSCLFMATSIRAENAEVMIEAKANGYGPCDRKQQATDSSNFSCCVTTEFIDTIKTAGWCAKDYWATLDMTRKCPVSLIHYIHLGRPLL